MLDLLDAVVTLIYHPRKPRWFFLLLCALLVLTTILMLASTLTAASDPALFQTDRYTHQTQR